MCEVSWRELVSVCTQEVFAAELACFSAARVSESYKCGVTAGKITELLTFLV